jgi:hypothetical protein
LEQLAAAARIGEGYLDLALEAGRVIDPTLDAASVRSQISKMADEVRAEAVGQGSPKDGVHALNHVVFGVHKFRVPASAAPVISGADAIDLYVLHRVVKSGKAHCEGLATLYAVVAEAAGLPVGICNAPIHTYCQFGTGPTHLNIECTQSGALRSDEDIHGINGAKPAAVGSDVYFCALNKRQFLCLQLNAMAYGLAKQQQGPSPLNLGQLVRLADLIEKLDPDRPESLDTAALIHWRAGNDGRAADIERRALTSAERLGAPDYLMAHYRASLSGYERKANKLAQ